MSFVLRNILVPQLILPFQFDELVYKNM